MAAESLQPFALTRFPLREEVAFSLNASIDDVFAYLDDFRKLSGHMERRSGMMIASKMKIELDAGEGRAVGSRVRMCGKVLGVSISLEEVITERKPPHHKTWETVDAALLVIGPYRLGFDLSPALLGTVVRILIEYELPQRGLRRFVGRFLGPRYARWCVERMASDAKAEFSIASCAHGRGESGHFFRRLQDHRDHASQTPTLNNDA